MCPPRSRILWAGGRQNCILAAPNEFCRRPVRVTVRGGDSPEHQLPIPCASTKQVRQLWGNPHPPLEEGPLGPRGEALRPGGRGSRSDILALSVSATGERWAADPERTTVDNRRPSTKLL